MAAKRGVRGARVRSAGAACVRSRTVRSVSAAQHEAAHVVVGTALGLRLVSATVGRQRAGGRLVDGLTEFNRRHGSLEAWLLMYAAGVAWERAMRREWAAAGDLAELRRMGCTTAGCIDALSAAAGALLRERMTTHARVTRILADRDLTHAEVAALARSEALPAGD
jgi:hypothetical protein